MVILIHLYVMFLDASPIIKESFAKQLLRTKRQKPGHPDEPMRVGCQQQTPFIYKLNNKA